MATVDKIIKLETGQVQMVNSSGDTLAVLLPSASLGILRQTNSVRCVDSTGLSRDVSANLTEYQILPAPPVAFSGNLADLFELLQSQFFFPIGGGGGGTGDNIYTIDGQITDPARQLDGVGTNTLLFNNLLALGIITANNSQLIVSDEITLDAVDLMTLIAFGGMSLTSRESSLEFTEFSDTADIKTLVKTFESVDMPSSLFESETYRWYNPDEGITYRWFASVDGGKWLSVQVFQTTFNENGNTPNNVFLKAGNTRTSLTEGITIADIVYFTELEYNNNDLENDQDLVLIQEGTVLRTDRLPVLQNGKLQFATPTLANGGKVSVQHLGAANNDMICTYSYRKSATNFALIFARIIPNPDDTNYLVSVYFTGLVKNKTNTIEIQFNAPFDGGEPVQNPIILNQVGSQKGLFEFDGQTFDAPATGETYNCTITLRDASNNLLITFDQDIIVE